MAWTELEIACDTADRVGLGTNDKQVNVSETLAQVVGKQITLADGVTVVPDAGPLLQLAVLIEQLQG